MIVGTRSTQGLVVACGIALGAAAPEATASMLANGSFELPPVAAGTASPVTPEGWQWVGSVGFMFHPTGPMLPAYDGAQYVDLGNTSAFSLRQDFSITAAGIYTLSWADNAAAFAQEAPYRFTVSGPSHYTGLFDANEGVDGAWTFRRVLLELASGDYALSFSPGDIPGPTPAQDRFIDGVALQPVPVPAALWLLAAPLAGIAAAGRRSR